MAINTWKAGDYIKNHSYIYEFGNDLLSLLKPKSNETILDIGCGTGNLTHQIAQHSSKVIGIDNSFEMLEKAKEQFSDIPFIKKDILMLDYKEKFDAVVSNAVLHWIDEKDQLTAAKAIYDALLPGGRYVAEFGGFMNCRNITDTFFSILKKYNIERTHKFYFPTIPQYGAVLENAGFVLTFATLFDRKTKLADGENGMANWLKMFLIPSYSEADEIIIKETEDILKHNGAFENGDWYADYVRIRIKAIKRA